MPNPLILVIGGAGYIGSYVNKLLNKSGFDTLVLDNLSKGYQKNVTAGTFILGDMGDKKCLLEIFKRHKVDAVMHFGAYTDVGESIKDPKKYYENNVVKTLTLLNTMVESKVLSLVFSSSAAIYGIPKTDIVTEESLKEPINPYGQTKLMVEKILFDYDRAYGMRSISLRYFNAAGADPDGEIALNLKLSNLIPVILNSLKEKKPFHLFGNDYPTKDGTCIRDYIHIHDLATAHIEALKLLLKKRRTDAYNLGNGQGFSVLEVVEAAKRATGQEVPYILDPRREGDPPVLIADSKKAKKELGWKPEYSDLETIISHAYSNSLV